MLEFSVVWILLCFSRKKTGVRLEFWLHPKRKNPKDNKDGVLHWHVCNRTSATFSQHSLHWSTSKFKDILYVGDNLSQTRGPMPFFCLLWQPDGKGRWRGRLARMSIRFFCQMELVLFWNESTWAKLYFYYRHQCLLQLMVDSVHIVRFITIYHG